MHCTGFMRSGGKDRDKYGSVARRGAAGGKIAHSDRLRRRTFHPRGFQERVVQRSQGWNKKPKAPKKKTNLLINTEDLELGEYEGGPVTNQSHEAESKLSAFQPNKSTPDDIQIIQYEEFDPIKTGKTETILSSEEKQIDKLFSMIEESVGKMTAEDEDEV